MSVDATYIRDVLKGSSGYIYENVDNMLASLDRLEAQAKCHVGCRGDVFATLAALFDMDAVHARSIISETRQLVEMKRRSVDRLQLVLYLLMRDDLPTGKLVSRVNEVEPVEKAGGPKYTSEYLAAYAKELAERILGAG